jgi:hypothetical protein
MQNDSIVIPDSAVATTVATKHSPETIHISAARHLVT